MEHIMEEIIWSCPCGDIKGKKIEDKAVLFQGIPYAHTKRFETPKLIESWNGVLDGTKGELDCFQFSSFHKESGGFYAREFRSNKTFSYDESPMTLNIVSPILEEAYHQEDDFIDTQREIKKQNSYHNCPVLLFIHGGGFETGTVGELPYGSCTAYAKNGVVFVSIGYRLNVFGLFGGTNYMLLDQLCAIDWVKKNISSFGGDPDNITLMGQSAGAMCIMDLLCSPLIKGKIRGAVMMSGAGVIPKFASALEKKVVTEFWEKVEAEAQGDAKNATAKDLWFAWKKVRGSINPLKGLRVSQPCIDGVTLLKSQNETIAMGELLDVPLMVGVTSQDMAPVFLYDMALKLGVACEQHGHPPVYGYFFDRVLPGDSYKSFHASDLWYMFGNMDKSWRVFEETDDLLHTDMVRDVVSFCTNQAPYNETWLPISKANKNFRHYDGVDKGMISEKCCRKKVRHSMFFERGPM